MTKTKPNGEQEDIFEAVLREHGFMDPFDYKLEIQVIGAFLKAPLRLNELQHIISPEAFYDYWTRRLYENIYKHYEKGEIEKINPDALAIKSNDEHRDHVINDILNLLHVRHIRTDELTDMIMRLNELAFRRKMLNAAFCILEDSYGESYNHTISKQIAYAEEISQRILLYVSEIKKCETFIDKLD